VKQLGLLSLPPDTVTLTPRKRVRQTSRNVYKLDRERLEGKRGQVLRILAAYFNEKQVSPTALELLNWSLARGEKFFDVNSLRPRLTELENAGLIATGPARKCAISGKVAHTWHVREVGD